MQNKLQICESTKNVLARAPETTYTNVCEIDRRVVCVGTQNGGLLGYGSRYLTLPKSFDRESSIRSDHREVSCQICM